MTAFQAEGYGGALSGADFKKGARALRHLDRSGAARSGEISRLHGQESIEEGDLSTQRIIGAIPICLPCRHAAPLEMTMLEGSIGHTCGVRVQRVV